MLQRMQVFVLALVLSVLSVSVAMATDPSYTVSFAQAQVDVVAVLVGLIAFTLVIFGGKRVLGLIRR